MKLPARVTVMLVILASVPAMAWGGGACMHSSVASAASAPASSSAMPCCSPRPHPHAVPQPVVSPVTNQTNLYCGGAAAPATGGLSVTNGVTTVVQPTSGTSPPPPVPGKPASGASEGSDIEVSLSAEKLGLKVTHATPLQVWLTLLVGFCVLLLGAVWLKQKAKSPEAGKPSEAGKPASVGGPAAVLALGAALLGGGLGYWCAPTSSQAPVTMLTQAQFESLRRSADQVNAQLVEALRQQVLDERQRTAEAREELAGARAEAVQAASPVRAMFFALAGAFVVILVLIAFPVFEAGRDPRRLAGVPLAQAALDQLEAVDELLDPSPTDGDSAKGESAAPAPAPAPVSPAVVEKLRDRVGLARTLLARAVGVFS